MTTTDTGVIARVQAAADRLLRLATAATPGTWAAVPVVYAGMDEPGTWEIHASGTKGVVEDVVSHQPHEGGGVSAAGDAKYIEGVQPAVAELLAGLLHTIADRMRAFRDAGLDPDDLADPAILALADKITSYGAAPTQPTGRGDVPAVAPDPGDATGTFGGV